MKKVDSGEFYTAKQDNTFSEYKPFSAEEYYSTEIADTPKESNSYNESFNNEGVNSTKSEGAESADARQIQKQYDRLNQTDSSNVSDTSATTTGANASQTASTVSGGTTAAASGATAGVTAVAAIVIVSAVVTGGFVADFKSHIGNDAGMDYVSITVDMDEIISQADKSYGLTADNFSIELNQGGIPHKVALAGGRHSYLITGLQPDKTYTYNLICNNPSLGSNSNCYSQTFTTLSAGEPKGVYDELNNYITYDETTQTATVGYSIYLSDFDNKYGGYAFYICSSEQTDLSDVNRIIYADETLDEDNFFRGEAEGITCNELYLYVVGERLTEYGAEAVELFSYKLNLDLPEEWQTAKNPAFVVDESAEETANQPDRISVYGKLNEFNENYTYFAYMVQYGKEGTALCDRQEVGLITDPENMTYNVAGEAYFGVNKYKYVIFTQDDDGNEITVYESGEKLFTESQAFGATYNKVQPTDATIEYGAGGVTITVDPEFTSEYNNYSYKLVVTNSLGEVYGEYSGTGIAQIGIADYTGLDEINFTYYDSGTFADGEREYAEHTTEGVAFCMPALSLDAEYGFDGQYFNILYTCDMIYGYAEASLDIAVIGSDGTSCVKHVDGVSENGIITLDHIEGEPGDVTISATLNFKDNQSDGATHSLNPAQAEYALNYSFELTKVTADLTYYSAETPVVTLDFDYLLPDGYKVKITDEANSINITSDLTPRYTLYDLSTDAEASLTIQVTDGGGNAWGQPKTVNISKSAAEAEYVAPTMSCPNPGDAVVTYNEDGTINIYREMIPSAFGRDTVSDDERVYYNAFIQGYYVNSDGVVDTEWYDVIGRGKYAVIENIPNQNYIFVYYTMFDFNGVSYVMYAETLSGSVENVYDCGVAAASVSDGQTVITVNVSKNGELANKIIVNGVEYGYTTYTDESETNPTLVIDGVVDVTEVTILFTVQGYNYDGYAAYSDLKMKGSKYAEHVVTVMTAEA